MSQQNAAVLYKSLPHLPNFPLSINAKNAALYANVPNPEADLPQEFDRDGTQPANEQIFTEYMRERFGPISVPPLHRDNNTELTKVTFEHFGSIREMTDGSGNIVSQQSYQPYGNSNQLQGSGPQSDFGFQKYYVHQRSGLNLAVHRAYNSQLGRWMSRDPIEDPAFNLMPKTQEPADSDPTIMTSNVLPLSTAPEIRAIAPMLAEMTPILHSQVRGMPLGSTVRNVLRAREPHFRKRPLSANVPESNLYVYVTNNPISFTDPSGLGGDWEWCKQFCDLYANSSALAWLICMMWCMDNTHQHCPPPTNPH